MFKCALDVDEAFRSAEPPTHDDWVYRAVPEGPMRSAVKIALERVSGHCREAAGYDSALRAASDGAGIPLGEFADALAVLMPGAPGPGARQRPRQRREPSAGARHRDVRCSTSTPRVSGSRVKAPVGRQPAVSGQDPSRDGTVETGARVPPSRIRPPQARSAGDPRPAIADDGTPVLRYPFELRGHGNRVRLNAVVEVMANDGGQVESEAPVGSELPRPRRWVSPIGDELRMTEVEVGPDGVDGAWTVEVPITDDVMMRVDIAPVIA